MRGSCSAPRGGWSRWSSRTRTTRSSGARTCPARANTSPRSPRRRSPISWPLASRAAREASGHEIGDRLLGERGEILARAGHVLAPDERVVLVREDHLLHPPLGAERSEERRV